MCIDKDINCTNKKQILQLFDFYEEEFLAFLEEYEYEVDDSVLNRLDFGDITLIHE